MRESTVSLPAGRFQDRAPRAWARGRRRGIEVHILTVARGDELYAAPQIVAKQLPDPDSTLEIDL